MFKLKSAVTAFGIAIAMAVVAPLATAQTVLVLDPSRIVRDSLGGQDIFNKVEQIGAAMQAELAPQQQALQTEGESLDSQAAGMTREQVEANPALLQQFQSYSRRLQQHMATTERRSQELQQTEAQALQVFGERMRTAVEGIRAARGALVVLNGQGVYQVAPEADITDEVIEELNRTSPTIPVTRVTLPDQSAAPAQ
ncbi:OmpH family outer membrane protein [Ponticaulis sp.]|uniref:OmpH family outer membrane protein n=1 Tax=Ponticaulis sp. TaxID=2020902 RepID=UPI002632063E|nr:OmpH family outer membrane protein [Ponticaulis sp.]MDF1681526.1 OmpH family outer membrane protein [Ponticaulis sp.]